MAAVPEWDLPESAGTSAFSLIPQMGKAQQQCEKIQLQGVRALSVRTHTLLFFFFFRTLSSWDCSFFF